MQGFEAVDELENAVLNAALKGFSF